MSNSNAVMINVSEDIIKAHVQAAVQQVLNRDPERLVKAVVDAAMSQKRNGYSNEKTIWEEQLNEAIRAVAQETFREWIESVKPAVAKMVRERFEGPKGKETIKTIVDKMTAALGSFAVHVMLPRD